MSLFERIFALDGQINALCPRFHRTALTGSEPGANLVNLLRLYKREEGTPWAC